MRRPMRVGTVDSYMLLHGSLAKEDGTSLQY